MVETRIYMCYAHDINNLYMFTHNFEFDVKAPRMSLYTFDIGVILHHNHCEMTPEIPQR